MNREEGIGYPLDQVRCGRCGYLYYKDDCYPTDDGGWICEGCADKYDRTPKDIEEDR